MKKVNLIYLLFLMLFFESVTNSFTFTFAFEEGQMDPFRPLTNTSVNECLLHKNYLTTIATTTVSTSAITSAITTAMALKYQKFVQLKEKYNHQNCKNDSRNSDKKNYIYNEILSAWVDYADRMKEVISVKNFLDIKKIVEHIQQSILFSEFANYEELVHFLQLRSSRSTLKLTPRLYLYFKNIFKNNNLILICNLSGAVVSVASVKVNTTNGSGPGPGPGSEQSSTQSFFTDDQNNEYVKLDYLAASPISTEKGLGTAAIIDVLLSSQKGIYLTPIENAKAFYLHLGFTECTIRGETKKMLCMTKEMGKEKFGI
ncbi:MAG: hypothetical protein HQK53_08170 [Oligoflexia bacterium]|nr:hypothetical protein [Oligoflexia bacterium]